VNLVCSNEECESHEEEDYMFNVVVVVGSDRELTENINKISSEYFECVFCDALAEDYKDEVG